MSGIIEQVGLGLPRVARAAIAAHLAGARVVSVVGAPSAPVFVTLRTAEGALRGCIGSLVPVEADLGAETARCAVLAATRDPRFHPVTEPELAPLDIEVSVLGPTEPVLDEASLDPRQYGVIVRGPGGERGVLLPDIAGVETVAGQIAIARQKAGLSTGQPHTLERFSVLKVREPAAPGAGDD